MSFLFTQAMRRRFTILSVLWVLFLPGAGIGPALAAESATVGGASKAETDHLIQSIEDPAARAKLVEQLKLLTAADKAAQDNEEPGLLDLLSRHIENASAEIVDAVSALSDLGRLWDWLHDQIIDSQLRQRWADSLGKIALVLLFGWATEWAIRQSLSGLQRQLDGQQPGGSARRLAVGLARWVLDLVPIGGFVATGYGLMTLPFWHLAGNGAMAAMLLMSGYALVRGGLALAQAVFMPGQGGIRFMPIDDESANYLFIWARRLTYTGVWGYFTIEALKLLGLPKGGALALVKLLGLVVATLLAILILQNRLTVASWIRGEDGPDQEKSHGWRNRLADIWHVLAVIYVVASFLVWALQVRGGFAFIVQCSFSTLAILGGAHFLNLGLANLVTKAFSLSEDLRGRFPHLEARANRYMAVMNTVLRVAVSLAAVMAIGQAWGANIVAWLASDLGRHLLSSGFTIFAVLFGAVILWEMVNAWVERYLAVTDEDGNVIPRSARARTLLPLFRNALLVVLVVLVSLIVLSELGVNIAPLLAGAGVIGVAIGFGSQKLVQDVITGAFIL
ncbi:MAG TPA: mechanosensitive ion channel, partial [Rhodospirillaceae bacterium]|nr:mechanosensitive ion channel [Rhodospirillaceae bacterium]